MQFNEKEFTINANLLSTMDTSNIQWTISWQQPISVIKNCALPSLSLRLIERLSDTDFDISST